MIFVSQEQGSADLAPLLEREGLEVVVCKLDYADIEFEGRGVKGVPVMVGVEVKQISELTGDYDRLAGHQIPKMLPNYAHRWLVYHGEWTQNKKGRLLKRTGKQRWRSHHGQADAGALRKKLLTLEMLGGVHCQYVKDKAAVVKFLLHLVRWWTDDDLDQHRSHIVVYQPHGLLQLTDTQKAIAAWPGIREKRAKAIAKTFKCVRKAANATVGELAEIETKDEDGKVRKIGPKTAEHIVRFLTNGK